MNTAGMVARVFLRAVLVKNLKGGDEMGNKKIVLTADIANDIALRAVAGYEHVQTEKKQREKKRLEIYFIEVFAVLMLFGLPLALICWGELGIPIPSPLTVGLMAGISWGLWLIILIDVLKEKHERFGFGRLFD